MALARRLVSILSALCLVASSAAAQQNVVYKHDQFDENIVNAATQISGTPINVQPGFARSEAWGQVYRPAANHYPVKILGVDMVMAGPPNLPPPAEAGAFLEFWEFNNTGPTPSGNSPLWSVHTADLFDPIGGTTDIPLTGDVAWSVDFDWENPANHPPLINSGNFALIIRFDEDPRDLQTEWNVLQCMVWPGVSCGCQEVAPIQDQGTTGQANLMQVISSGCNPPASVWHWANSIGVAGDFILRIRAEVAGGCNPDCLNRDCGDDGCGGSCGSCTAPEVCDALGQCVCVPDCAGRCCGDDGCGGQCPDGCGAGWSCNAGSCSCVPAACTDGQTRCTGDLVEQCVASAWVALQDCTLTGQLCVGGQCEGVCAPDCAAKVCGDDGCGASCGECGAGQICQAGQCIPGGDPLRITAISPDFGFNDVATDVSITGSGFASDAVLRLGGTDLTGVQVVSAGLIDTSVPAGMEPGLYMLIVANPGGQTASLDDAFEVRRREVPDGGNGGDSDDPGQSSGCGCLATGGGQAPAGLLLGMLLFLGRRRRT